MSTSGGSPGAGYQPLPVGASWNTSPGALSAAVTVNQSLRLYPVFLPTPTVFQSAAINVTVIGDAGCKIAALIYADNGHGFPAALLTDIGQAAGDAVGLNVAGGPFTAPAGWQWWGSLLTGAPVTTPTVTQVASTQIGPNGTMHQLATPTGASWNAIQNAQAAPPAMFGGALNAGIIPLLTATT